MLAHFFVEVESRMPYRRTENVVRRLAARREAILQAAAALAGEAGIAAVQITPVARRAGVAVGTVYRYFPSKDDLVAALATAVSEREIGAMRSAADAAPGPLSALAAALTTYAARALADRKLAFALIAEPAETAEDTRLSFRAELMAELGKRAAAAIRAGLLPEQDIAVAAPAVSGALIEGLIGPLAPQPRDERGTREAVQMLTLFALRGLGVADARARGLVVQTKVPGKERTG